MNIVATLVTFILAPVIIGMPVATFGELVLSSSSQPPLAPKQVAEESHQPATVRTATFVVAASNSTPQGRAQADYVCDGLDDQMEINTAINALPDGGGAVQLLEGTFKISSPITIIKDRVALRGQGRGATKIYLANNSNCNVIEINNPPDASALWNIELTNFQIDGNKEHQTKGHGIAIAFFRASIISNLQINNCKQDGINCAPSETGANGTNCTFENLGISDCDGNGITFDHAPWESIIDWAFIRNVGGYQVDMIGTPRVHISQCHFGGSNGGNSILRVGPRCNFLTIEGTWFSSVYTDTHGIEIWSDNTEATYQVNIVGNILHGHLWYGKGESPTHDGIYLHTEGKGVRDILISGNNIHGFRYGINLFDKDVKRTLIDGNNLASNDAGAIKNSGSDTLIGDNITERSIAGFLSKVKNFIKSILPISGDRK